MKKTLFVPVLAMAAVLSVSCSKEETDGVENGPVNGGEAALFAPQSVISASSAATKTALDGVNINWEEGDAITLFGENGASVKYTLTEGAGATVGTFEAEGELPAQVQAYAVYPAVAEGVTLSEDKVAVSVAAEQTYNAAGFPAEYPMAAVTSDGQNFTFGNLATVLSLPLQGDAVVRSISIEAVGGEGLAGAATVDFSGATPVLSAGNSATVTLDCGESGVQLSADAATVFNFILIPGEYTQGFKVTVNETNGNSTVKTTGGSAMTMHAGSIVKIDSAIPVVTPQGWNLVGGFVGNWSSWIEMEGGNGLYYCSDVTVPADAERNQFKVRYGANEWYGYSDTGTVTSVTLQKVFTIYRTGGVPGSGDEWAGKDNGNLRVEPAGTYDFYFVENNHEVIVMPAGVAPFVLTGTINEWGETPFEIENGLMIARNISFSGNDKFKIKLAKISDDDEGKNWDGGYNIGSNNGQPIVSDESYSPNNSTGSSDISTSVTGTYDITFDIKKNSIIMTASQN